MIKDNFQNFKKPQSEFEWNYETEIFKKYFFHRKKRNGKHLKII